MQQTEEAEGGLADIEKPALRDLGEMAGAKVMRSKLVQTQNSRIVPGIASGNRIRL